MAGAKILYYCKPNASSDFLYAFTFKRAALTSLNDGAPFKSADALCSWARRKGYKTVYGLRFASTVPLILSD